MKQDVQTLKGFRDFIGIEAKKRQWFINTMRRVYDRFGFQPLETPAIEYESLLAGKYGEEADKLLYRFEDNGGRKVALRYDQTVPTARVVAQYQSELVFPYKRYQIQPVWRADKPQKGRYRELFQSDADIIGSTSPLADAEILALYASIYKEFGLDTLKIYVNDRKTLIQSIKDCGISEEMVFSVIQTIDKLDKKTEEEVKDELVSKGLNKETAQEVLNKLQSKEIPKELANIVSIAQKMAPEATFIYKPSLARGLDYYTGLIFEGSIPEYTAGSVGGGGRYDFLIKNLVGVDMPAVGFAVGFDRTLEAAQELGKVPDFSTTSQVLVTVFSPELLSESIKLASNLRNENVSTECFLEEGKRLDQQLKYANKKKIPYVVIMGPDEAPKKIVLLKNMQTGEQKEVKMEDIVKMLNG